MSPALVPGLVAGAAGTVALNITTYADMALRGRGASSTPQKTVQRLAEQLGTELARPGEAVEQVGNREAGLGALMGYATGLTVGLAYGLLRPRIPQVPRTAAGVGVGLLAMAASDLPMTALGVTDPRTWPRSSWLMDLVPHLVYGMVTASVHDNVVGGAARPRASRWPSPSRGTRGRGGGTKIGRSG